MWREMPLQDYDQISLRSTLYSTYSNQQVDSILQALPQHILHRKDQAVRSDAYSLM